VLIWQKLQRRRASERQYLQIATGDLLGFPFQIVYLKSLSFRVRLDRGVHLKDCGILIVVNPKRGQQHCGECASNDLFTGFLRYFTEERGLFSTLRSLFFFQEREQFQN
jgi:hypothetical protein